MPRVEQRLRKLEAKAREEAARPCRRCLGRGGQTQMVAVNPGEPLPERTPCPSCGKLPFCIIVSRSEARAPSD